MGAIVQGVEDVRGLKRLKLKSLGCCWRIEGDGGEKPRETHHARPSWFIYPPRRLTSPDSNINMGLEHVQPVLKTPNCANRMNLIDRPERMKAIQEAVALDNGRTSCS